MAQEVNIKSVLDENEIDFVETALYEWARSHRYEDKDKMDVIAHKLGIEEFTADIGADDEEEFPNLKLEDDEQAE